MGDEDSDSGGTYEVSAKTRCPTFSGKKKDWPDYKLEMEAHMFQSGLDDPLECDKDAPKDDETLD